MTTDQSPTESLIAWVNQWQQDGARALTYCDQKVIFDFIQSGADINTPSILKLLSSKTNIMFGLVYLIIQYEVEGKGKIRSENGSNFFHILAEHFPWKLAIFLNSPTKDDAVICNWLNETRYSDNATPLLASAKNLIHSLADENPYKDQKHATHLINLASKLMNRGYFISHQDKDGMSITNYLYEAMSMGIKTDIESDTKEKLCLLLAYGEEQKLEANTAIIHHDSKKGLRL